MIVRVPARRAAFDPAHTIGIVGDVHFGAMLPEREAPAKVDLIGMRRRIAARAYVGDLADTSANRERAAARAFIHSVGPDAAAAIVGNHDLENGGTVADFTAGVGYDPDWTLDVGDDIRLIGISHRANGATGSVIVYQPATLAFLDAALATDRSCVIIAHAPLKNSVTEPAPGKTSVDAFYYAAPHADIVAVLAARPSARVWCSGHTHSSLTATNLMMGSYALGGGRTIAAVNVSALSSVQVKPGTAAQPNHSCYLTVWPDVIYVRWRDHKTRTWQPVAGAVVTRILPGSV